MTVVGGGCCCCYPWFEISREKNSVLHKSLNLFYRCWYKVLTTRFGRNGPRVVVSFQSLRPKPNS